MSHNASILRISKISFIQSRHHPSKTWLASLKILQNWFHRFCLKTWINWGRGKVESLSQSPLNMQFGVSALHFPAKYESSVGKKVGSGSSTFNTLIDFAYIACQNSINTNLFIYQNSRVRDKASEILASFHLPPVTVTTRNNKTRHKQQLNIQYRLGGIRWVME